MEKYQITIDCFGYSLKKIELHFRECFGRNYLSDRNDYNCDCNLTFLRANLAVGLHLDDSVECSIGCFVSEDDCDNYHHLHRSRNFPRFLDDLSIVLYN